MKEILCGIDLGTTNSSIAYLSEGKPMPVEIEEGSAIVPSVVSLDEATNQIVVGRAAKNRLAAFPEHTVRSIKRLMGKDIQVSLGKRMFSRRDFVFYPEVPRRKGFRTIGTAHRGGRHHRSCLF